MVHIVYISTLFIIGLSTFDAPFVIWNAFISNEFNPPYIMTHVILKFALSDLPMRVVERTGASKN